MRPLQRGGNVQGIHGTTKKNTKLQRGSSGSAVSSSTRRKQPRSRKVTGESNSGSLLLETAMGRGCRFKNDDNLKSKAILIDLAFTTPQYLLRSFCQVERPRHPRGCQWEEKQISRIVLCILSPPASTGHGNVRRDRSWRAEAHERVGGGKCRRLQKCRRRGGPEGCCRERCSLLSGVG